MEDRLSLKAQELVNAFKTAEAKWIEDLNQKDDFIRRRDHTIATQIETFNSMSTEISDLVEKNKKLETDSQELEKKLDAEQAEKQKCQMEKISLMRRYIEAKKDVENWKAKYTTLRNLWKEDCKRRADTLSDDDNLATTTTNPPSKVIRLLTD